LFILVCPAEKESSSKRNACSAVRRGSSIMMLVSSGLSLFSWAEIDGIINRSPVIKKNRANSGIFSFYPPRSN